MADYYVDDTNGDDSTGDGSSGSPWKTIQKALNDGTWSTSGGNVLYLANTSAFVLSSTIDVTTPAINNDSRTDNNPFVFAAWDNGGSISITVPNGRTISPAFEIDGNDAVATIISTTTSAFEFTAFVGGKLHGTTGAVVDFYHSNQDGSALINCEVYDTANYYVVDEANMIIGCYIHNTGGSSQAATSNSAMFWNYVKGMGTFGASFNGYSDHCVGNIFEDCGGSVGAIRIANDAVLCAHNIVDGHDDATNSVGLVITSGTGFCYLLDNIIANVDGTGATAYNIASNSGQFIIQGNRDYNCTAVGTRDEGYANDNTTESSDPFTDSASNDYTIDSGADAYQSGTAITPSVAPNAGPDNVDTAAGGGGGETAHTYAS